MHCITSHHITFPLPSLPFPSGVVWVRGGRIWRSPRGGGGFIIKTVIPPIKEQK